MIQNFIKTDIHDYSELIKSNKIQTMLNNIPDGLTKLEKAYYVYLELGKILNENPKDVLTPVENIVSRFGTNIDENYNGVCLSICELYASILKDPKINIDCDITKRIPTKAVSHYDAILKIDGNNYMTALVRDLTNIKTNMRTKWFAFNLVDMMSLRLISIDKFAAEKGLKRDYIDRLLLEVRQTKNYSLIDNYIENLKQRSNADFSKLNRLLMSVSYEQAYLGNIRRTYNQITYLTKNDIEKLDSKLGYSFCNIYTNDVLAQMTKEFKNNDIARQYILEGKHVPKSDLLDYKMDYITQNIDKFVERNSNLHYIEQIACFTNFLSNFISLDESKRLEFYALKIGKNEQDVISLIKLKPYKEGNQNKFYLYSMNTQKYEKKSADDLKDYFSTIPSSDLQILGKNRMYDPRLASLKTQKDIDNELLK